MDSITEKRMYELAILSQLSQTLASQLDPAGLWEPLRQHLTLLFEDSMVFVGLYDATSDRLSFPLNTEEDELPLLPLHQALIRHGLALHFHDIQAADELLTLFGVYPQRQAGQPARCRPGG